MADGLKLYHLFAVDAVGIASATYEFKCMDEEEARARAKTYLGHHDVLELWIDHRRIAWLKRSD